MGQGTSPGQLRKQYPRPNLGSDIPDVTHLQSDELDPETLWRRLWGGWKEDDL
jgi:hypothetical protein